MLDYRKERRLEAFMRWYAWSLQYKDCDPSVWLANYLNERYEHNSEERLWFAWLYGNTYELPTAWVIKQEFPDFELADQARVVHWNSHNYPRLRYQTDTKWNKGHLAKMLSSYKDFVGERTQAQAFAQYYADNERATFTALWAVINERWYKFGRYSTWFYLQQLKHTCNVPLEPTSLMLSDYGGSRSHRNGLLYALGQESKIDLQLSKSEYNNLEVAAKDILEEMRHQYPQFQGELDYFTMETVLCSFKKLFRERHSRYLGYYLDRQAEDISKAQGDGWAGIDWDVLWQARQELLDPRLTARTGVDKTKFVLFARHGVMDRLAWMFPEVEQKFGLETFQ